MVPRSIFSPWSGWRAGSLPRRLSNSGKSL
jgi:hypothetical protein